MQERIQKYLARCGVASRRKAEEMIIQGRVKINGIVVREIVIVDEEKDIVEVDGKEIKGEEKKIYIMLNKPVGFITSVDDQFDRKTVMDVVDIKERVYPVGRLDYDTSGLLILTNDGDITYRMTHPSHEINKVYRAEIIGTPNDTEINQFKRGLKIEDYITAPAEIKVLDRREKDTIVEITIHEGRNRQVRKMCDKIGHPVIKLRRIAMGELKIGSLEPGKWRYLTEKEIEYLKSL